MIHILRLYPSEVSGQGVVQSLSQLQNQKILVNKQSEKIVELNRMVGGRKRNIQIRQTLVRKNIFPDKAAVPIIIERRLSEENWCRSDIISPKCITTTLFKTPNHLTYQPFVNNDQQISRQDEGKTNEIVYDDNEFFRRLEELIYLTELEQLAPHFGDETFDVDNGVSNPEQETSDIIKNTGKEPEAPKEQVTDY